MNPVGRGEKYFVLMIEELTPIEKENCYGRTVESKT